MAPDYQDLLQARIKQLEQQLAAVREENAKLRELCKAAVEEFGASRPNEVFDHIRAALSPAQEPKT